MTGDAQAALDRFQRAPIPQTRVLGQALCLERLGRRAEADRALEQLTQDYGLVAAWEVAQVHAARGNRDAAFEWLERAYRQHDGYMAFVKFDPLLDSLRGDPRYAALLRKMNLPVD
jgi:serine/threonine-protein kinase